MIIFWILAGGLVAMALAFALTPLMSADRPVEAPAQDALNLEVFRQRLQELDADLASGFLDQAQYDAARHDLERDLLHDLDGQATADTKPGSKASRWLLAGVLVIGVPAASLYLYLLLGVPEIIDRLQAAPMADNQVGADGQPMASMDELVTRLEERLKKDPKNLEGWLMLGRTYFATERPEKALAAVKTAYELAPDNPDVMLSYAEALAATSPNRSLEGRPAELIKSALEKAPQSPAARWLNGMLDFQRGNYQAAVDGWQEILAELDPKGEEAKNLKSMIDEARSRGGLAAPTGAADSTGQASTADAASEPGEAKGPEAAASASIQVDVKLDPSIADQAKPDDSVFVFVRAASGPPMPLAVQRIQVKDLPTSVTLDDSMAMMPQMRLSAFDEVVVGARISKSGEAMPQSGDLEGESGTLKRAETPKVGIAIDRIRP